MSIEMLKNECRAEGREEGREAKGKEAAVAMLREKLAESLVAKCTGLSIDEVRALAATL